MSPDNIQENSTAGVPKRRGAEEQSSPTTPPVSQSPRSDTATNDAAQKPTSPSTDSSSADRPSANNGKTAKEAPPQPKEEKKKSTDKKIQTRKKKGKKKGQVYLKKISPSDIEFTLRHMSLMLRSGLSLTEALAVIVEQISDERLQEIYTKIYADVQGGMNIADAMNKYPKVFSEVVISIVKISEQTGTLESNLLYLAEYLKKSYELQRKVKGALIYPLIVLGMTGAEMFGVVFFIMPKMETMFLAFENVPAFSVAIVTIARVIRENVLFIGIGLVILGFILSRYFKTKSGKRFVDKVALKFPIINNLNTKNILASFARTLGMLLESGIPISKSLQITGQTMTNVWYSEVVLKLYKDVKEGKNLADSMLKYDDYFPISFIRIIQASERTGTLEENLTYMYESFSGEVEEMANNMVTLLEPLLLMLAGAMIGLLAITIVAPIYQFTSSIN